MAEGGVSSIHSDVRAPQDISFVDFTPQYDTHGYEQYEGFRYTVKTLPNRS